MISVGVDSSTSCTAVCALDDAMTVRFIGHVSSVTGEDELDRCSRIMAMLQQCSSCVPHIDAIVLEQATFGYGMKTTARTLCKLHRQNSQTNLMLYQMTGTKPNLVSAQTARLWLGRLNAGDRPIKRTVFDEVVSRGMYSPRYTRAGNPVGWCLDEVDALVLAGHGLTLL